MRTSKGLVSSDFSRIIPLVVSETPSLLKMLPPFSNAYVHSFFNLVKLDNKLDFFSALHYVGTT